MLEISYFCSQTVFSTPKVHVGSLAPNYNLMFFSESTVALWPGSWRQNYMLQQTLRWAVWIFHRHKFPDIRRKSWRTNYILWFRDRKAAFPRANWADYGPVFSWIRKSWMAIISRWGSHLGKCTMSKKWRDRIHRWVPFRT